MNYFATALPDNPIAALEQAGALLPAGDGSIGSRPMARCWRPLLTHLYPGDTCSDSGGCEAVDALV